MNLLLSKNKMDAVYIIQLKVFNIATISRICRRMKIISFSCTPQYLNDRISIGFDMLKGKLKVIINLKNVRKEGAKFSSRLLKLAGIR